MSTQKYKLIKAYSSSELEITVQELLGRGWTCQGGVSICIVQQGTRYFQAMTYYDTGIVARSAKGKTYS